MVEDLLLYRLADLKVKLSSSFSPTLTYLIHYDLICSEPKDPVGVVGRANIR